MIVAIAQLGRIPSSKHRARSAVRHQHGLNRLLSACTGGTSWDRLGVHHLEHIRAIR